MQFILHHAEWNLCGSLDQGLISRCYSVFPQRCFGATVLLHADGYNDAVQVIPLSTRAIVIFQITLGSARCSTGNEILMLL